MTAPTSNRFIGVNYIPDNPKMEVPPAFWLQRFHDFDSDLVILPSREKPFAYVLARRRRRSPRPNPKLVAIVGGDTAMCHQYDLVFVFHIFRLQTGTWPIDELLQELRSRDTWAVGGGNDMAAAERVADIMDAADAKAEAARKAAIRQDMWHRSGDAYRSYKARTGQRVTLTNTPLPTKGTYVPTTATVQ